MRLTADSRFFIPLPKKIVFKGRGYFGYINSLDNTPVGLFDRFFLGGVNTLRGFNINTVGPSLRVPTTQTGGDTAFVYGGNKSLMFNAELELPIYAPAGFQAVAFVDTGNAYGETENIDISKFRSNYGFGFRWQSPFGPLRFEWGFPIDKRAGESSTVFNFTIGESF
jgi:outer membrane protein insertion porin family